MPRPQFNLKTLLWLMALASATFGGMAWQRSLDREHEHALRTEIRLLEIENAVLSRYARAGAISPSTVVRLTDDD
jgi:hypothetical protein